jgi:hypothetical protein
MANSTQMSGQGDNNVMVDTDSVIAQAVTARAMARKVSYFSFSFYIFLLLLSQLNLLS